MGIDSSAGSHGASSVAQGGRCAGSWSFTAASVKLNERHSECGRLTIKFAEGDSGAKLLDDGPEGSWTSKTQCKGLWKGAALFQPLRDCATCNASWVGADSESSSSVVGMFVMNISQFRIEIHDLRVI